MLSRQGRNPCAGRRRRAPARVAWLTLALVLAHFPSSPAETSSEQRLTSTKTRTGLIGIIIDDLGNNLSEGIQAIELPGAVSYSFLPETPYAARLANLAHAVDKEVLLHLPMQSEDSQPLGPGGLTQTMSRQELIQSVQESLAAVPHVAGINNHMGSLLTRQTDPMAWLMQAIREHGDLFFIDSRTTRETVAATMAAQHRVPHMPRDVFLDEKPGKASTLAQFQLLVSEAKREGRALAIGHPYPETIEVLDSVLPSLGSYGVRLVPVSVLIENWNGATWDGHSPERRDEPGDSEARYSLSTGHAAAIR